MVISTKNKTIIPILLLLFLQSCFPDFAPEKHVNKVIQTNDIALEWYSYIGIIDQNFPDIIIARNNGRIDTICKAHNLADLKFDEKLITIGFYGNPRLFLDSVRIIDEVAGYKILMDTTYTNL